MKINISSKWLLLSINHDSQYLAMINNFVNANFKKTIKLSDTTIIFHDNNELRKKKQLLFWISNVYAKVNKNTLPSFLKTIVRAEELHLKIKIIYSQKSLTPNVILTIRRYSNQNIVVIKSSLMISKTMSQFLKLFFKDCDFLDINGYDIGIHCDSIEATKKLKELVYRNKILQFKVECKYDSYVKSLLENTNEEHRKKLNEESLTLEVEKAFLVLGVSKDEEFMVVKKRYLKLAKEYHPDSVFDKSSEIVQAHTKKFQEIQEAFESVKLYFKSV